MADEVDERGDVRPFRRPRVVDRQIAERARRQYGVVTSRQLRELGLGAAAVEHRRRAGRLHRVHRGVYAVGHPLLRRHGIRLAAVLGRNATKEQLEQRFRAFLDANRGTTHHTRHAFESDRARDRKAIVSGHRVVRITWRQLHEDATTLATELRALLSPSR